MRASLFSQPISSHVGVCMKRLLALVPLIAASLAPLRVTAQTFPDRHATGFIWSVNRSEIMLQNHLTIFLRHGTEIEPRGQRLEVGQRIVVQGETAGHGNVNASSIRIVGKTYASNGGYGSWYGGRDDLAAAVIHPPAPKKPRTIVLKRGLRRAPTTRHQAFR